MNEVVEASLHKQLRGLSQYTWDAWDDAATYMVDNKMDLKEALKYEDNSIGNEERFENLMTKSRILDAMGQPTEATAARDKALAMGSAPQLYGYGRQLQREGKQKEAFAVYKSGGSEVSRQLAVARRPGPHRLRSRQLSGRDQADATGAGRSARPGKIGSRGLNQAAAGAAGHQQVGLRFTARGRTGRGHTLP